MDLQDIFFFLICGWAASVYDLAPVQQPHAAAAGRKTRRQSSRLVRQACATCTLPGGL